MEVNGHHHASAALSPGEMPRTLIEYEARLERQPIWGLANHYTDSLSWFPVTVEDDDE
jgi:hypothetical protein